MSGEIENKWQLETRLNSIERDVEFIKNDYVTKTEWKTERCSTLAKVFAVVAIILTIVLQILMSKNP